MTSVTLRALAVLYLLAPSSWAGGGWEIDVGAGMLGRADFAVLGPFTYRGVSFEREYTNCQPEFRDHPRGALFGCFVQLGFLGSFNAVYSREHEYGPTFIADVGLRRRLSGPFSLAAGVLGGLASGRQQVNSQRAPMTLDVPPFPPEVLAALQDPDITQFRHTDTGVLAYLHAALRYEWRFGGRADSLQPTGHGVFVDGGGGILPAVPGGEESRVGTPLAWHVGAGLRWSRSLARDVTVSIVHVHALADPPEGIVARYSWTGVRLGLIIER